MGAVMADGTEVRALASHQCVPGSISGPGVMCEFSLLLVLYSPGSITNRCSRKEPALPRTHGWTRGLGIANFDESEI